MLQLDNGTPFAAERAILLDVDGQEFWTVIVKGTFDIGDGVAVPAENQEPVTLAPQFNGEPGVSSLKYDTDITLFKPATDVLLNGAAYSPGGRPSQSIHARLRVASIDKRIIVHGDRVWDGGMGGIEPSAAKRFERMPILYERAFGGADPVEGGAGGFEERNPVGVGFASRSRHLLGTPAPNLEHPTDRSRPAALGPISASWQPRRGWLGTCDEKWQEERMPLYPTDLDPRFFQTAPEDQITGGYLHGGEAVALENFTPNGSLSFHLPRVALGFVTLFGSQLLHHRADLDTVIIEPDLSRVLLTWRTRLPCHGRKFDVKWTRIYEKEFLKAS